MTNVALTETIIELSVPDFEKAKDFYTKLGFEVVWEEPPKGMNGYMVMKYGRNILCFFCGNEEVFNHPYFKNFPKDTIRGYGVEISLPIENIDSLLSRYIITIAKKEYLSTFKITTLG